MTSAGVTRNFAFAFSWYWTNLDHGQVYCFSYVLFLVDITTDGLQNKSWYSIITFLHFYQSWLVREYPSQLILCFLSWSTSFPFLVHLLKKTIRYSYFLFYFYAYYIYHLLIFNIFIIIHYYHSLIYLFLVHSNEGISPWTSWPLHWLT